MTNDTTNAYCEPLGIDVPALERVKNEREANTYSLLITALLERGEPMTLDEVALRFEEAGIAPAHRARHSLRRCKPGRLPVVRDGDLYGLDVHHDELELWAFRLGLRPPRVPPLRIVRDAEPAPDPPPPPDVPLTVDEVDLVLRHADPYTAWTSLRYATAVLEAHGRAMTPDEVEAFVAERTGRPAHLAGQGPGWHRGLCVRVREDGAWELRPGHEGIPPTRRAVRERLLAARERQAARPPPADVAAMQRASEIRRRERARMLARERRAVVHSFPSDDPEAVVLLDAAERRIETYLRPDLERARAELERFDAYVGVDLRARLRALGFDPGPRRLVDLGTHQKSLRLNRRGRTLRITLDLLIRSSCRLSRPLGDAKTLRRYARTGETTRLRRRLEADAKSLLALHDYARLHHGVRLQWGFLDEILPAPWVPFDEEGLYSLMKQTEEEGGELEVVLWSAPGWADPWSRARRCRVEEEGHHLELWMLDDEGFTTRVERWDVQAARVV